MGTAIASTCFPGGGGSSSPPHAPPSPPPSAPAACTPLARLDTSVLAIRHNSCARFLGDGRHGSRMLLDTGRPRWSTSWQISASGDFSYSTSNWSGSGISCASRCRCGGGATFDPFMLPLIARIASVSAWLFPAQGDCAGAAAPMESRNISASFSLLAFLTACHLDLESTSAKLGLARAASSSTLPTRLRINSAERTDSVEARLWGCEEVRPLGVLGARLALSLRPRFDRFMLPLIACIASVSAWLFPAQGDCAGVAAPVEACIASVSA
eukprot:scaffold33571_cov59-Phaeocystis_antarctica.AAC.2